METKVQSALIDLPSKEGVLRLEINWFLANGIYSNPNTVVLQVNFNDPGSNLSQSLRQVYEGNMDDSDNQLSEAIELVKSWLKR